MSRWNFILADPATGAEVGEIWQADERRVVIPYIGGPGGSTVTGTIDGLNPMVPVMVGSSAEDRLDCLLKAYRDEQLMCVNDLVTGEEAADAESERFPFGASGPLGTRLNTRMVGKSTAGYAHGTPSAQVDLGSIIAGAISVVNAEQDTGIRVGDVDPSTQGYLERSYFKKVGELAVDLSQLLGGPDIRIDPVEPVVDVSGLKIGEFRAAPVIGTQQPTAIFEFGTGKRNVQSWRRPLDWTGGANVAYHTAPGFPDSIDAGVTAIVSATNPHTVGHRRREDLVTADLQPAVLRQQLVNEHVRIRGYPRETIVFVPAPNCDVAYGTHYVEGDIVEARAVRRNGTVAFDALFRIYQVAFAIDALGVETVELLLVNEGVQVL